MDNPTQSDALEQSDPARMVGPAGAVPPKKPRVGAVLRPDVAPQVERYDFRTPTFLSEPDLRRLRLLHEDFVRYASGRLSLYLRMEFGMTLAKVATVNYAKFTEGLPTPTHITLFKLDPLNGVGVLDMNPRLALTIADRLLGGRGNATKADRHLTEIEVALIEDVVSLLLEEWCSQWKAEQELRPAVIGHEHSGRFLQTSARDAIMLGITLDCAMGDCTGQMQLGIPYYTIEPLVRKTQAKRHRENTVTAVARRTEWQSAYDGIGVPVRAEWEAFQATVRELAALSVGDVIQLDPMLISQTNLLVNGVPKFVGVAGLDGERVAVQVTRKISQEETPYAKLDGRKSA